MLMTDLKQLAVDAPYPALEAVEAGAATRRMRWHIAVFLAPALLVYTAIMIVPLIDTLRLALYTRVEGVSHFVGLDNFRMLFGDARWSLHFWQALRNNVYFFVFHMVLQNPIGVALAALLSLPRLRGGAFYRTVFFLPTMLSFVIVGFTWKLILSPIWGVTPSLLGALGLKSWFHPWLGQESSALTTLALISVWQYVGIPLMLIYAALLGIPEEVLEAAELDGIPGLSQFLKVKLPLICLRPDQHGPGRAGRAQLLDRHPGHLPVPHLFRQPAPARRPEHGCRHRHRDVRDHPVRRLDLSLRHPEADAALPVLRGRA